MTFVRLLSPCAIRDFLRRPLRGTSFEGNYIRSLPNLFIDPLYCVSSKATSLYVLAFSSSTRSRYVINVTDCSGETYIIFNGGYVDSTGSLDSKYIFSDVKIY